MYYNMACQAQYINFDINFPSLDWMKVTFVDKTGNTNTIKIDTPPKLVNLGSLVWVSSAHVKLSNPKSKLQDNIIYLLDSNQIIVMQGSVTSSSNAPTINFVSKQNYTPILSCSTLDSMPTHTPNTTSSNNTSSNISLPDIPNTSSSPNTSPIDSHLDKH